MTRSICVVTGTRAEYGLLRWVMEGVRDTPGLELQVVATGMHLSAEFGSTYREIEQDGLSIDWKVDMKLDSDSPAGITKSMSLGLAGFADAFAHLVPDIVVVLGDRFEILMAATAAMIARVPIAHIHGGESSEGAIDEAIRHAITKMAHLHFVAAAEYRQRVIQLGEQPDRVFLVGGLGVDSIARATLLDRVELEASLGFQFGERNLLVTFHPATLDAGASAAQMHELFAALDEVPDVHVILTMPNADAEGRELFGIIERFVAGRRRARAFTSLGHQRYLSCMRYVDAVVGNSSSGITEAPTFGIGTINIGDRQRGRLRAASVIDCLPTRSAIVLALGTLYSPEFQARLKTVKNPYGEPGASERVVRTLASVRLDDILKKRFFDLPSP